MTAAGRSRLVLAGVLAALALGPGSRAQDTVWYAMTDSVGATLGHASHTVRAATAGRETLDVQKILLQERDGPRMAVTTHTTTVFGPDGRARSMVVDTETGTQRARIVAQILADRAVVTRRSPAGQREVVVPLPAGVRFDSGEPLLAAWRPGATPRIEFLRFEPDTPSVERIVIEAAPSQGPGLSAVRWRYQGDELRGVARLQLDDRGRVQAVIQPMYGAAITIRATDEQTATRPHPPYRGMAAAQTRSPVRISDSALHGRIRYRVSFRDGLAFPIPQTAEQRALVQDGVATLDICATCGPGLAADPQTLAAARAPTPWLQSDHRRLQQIAGPFTRMKVSDARKMELLTERARQVITRIDFTGHFSALDAISRRRGDCTESAVVLAALGRAAGIPTKVVNGLVYSRETYHGVSNTFMPHSWVLAYVDGAWRSYDSAVFGFDNTHIALVIGDGDARSVAAAAQLINILKWESLTEVRPRPSA